MNVRRLARAGIIAAVYVVLCVALAPFAYGPVQVRVSEALTLLPVLCPEAVLGVTVGCFVANLVAGVPVDMVVGTLATLCAALCTRRLRRVRWTKARLPLAAAIPPVAVNAVAVGAELTLLYFPAASPAAVWLANMASVGAGQLISCGLGVALVALIERSPAMLRLVGGEGAV